MTSSANGRSIGSLGSSLVEDADLDHQIYVSERRRQPRRSIAKPGALCKNARGAVVFRGVLRLTFEAGRCPGA
jgi:hypothetical protein